MKTILLILFFPTGAFAQPYGVGAGEPVVAVSETFSSTMTCFSAQISTSIPTALIQNIKAMYRSLTIQNRSANQNLWFSENVNVSSQTGTAFNSLVGVQIAPGNPGASVPFNIVPGVQYYCLSDAASASQLATICLGH